MGKYDFQKIRGKIKCLFNKHQTTFWYDSDLAKSFLICIRCGNKKRNKLWSDGIPGIDQEFLKKLRTDIYSRTLPVKETVLSMLTLDSMKVAIEKVIQNPLYGIDRLYLSEKAKDKLYEEIKDQLIYEVKEPDGDYIMGMKLLVNIAVPDDMILMCSAKEVIAIVNLKEKKS